MHEHCTQNNWNLIAFFFLICYCQQSVLVHTQLTSITLILSFYFYRQEKVAREFIDNNSSFAEVEETQSQAKKKGQMFRQKFDLSLKQPNFS